jgi:hypothetical protein
VSGVFQSGASGASISFQNTNFTYQVDGSGNISASGQINLTGLSSAMKIGGTTVIDVSRNGFFNNLTVTSCTGCSGGSALSFTATNTGTSLTFSNSSLTFQVNGNGNVGATSVGITSFLQFSFGANIFAPNGLTGVTCSGTPSSSFATSAGIVTHC